MKLMSTKKVIASYLHSNNSNIILAPEGQQLSNGLFEQHWRTMAEMGHEFLTEKQMPWAFWFQAIQHAARMMNCIPGRVHDHLTSNS